MTEEPFKENAVRAFLRSSEEATSLLDALSFSEDLTRSDDNGHVDEQRRRLLAVVVHTDEIDGHEVGSVFVLKADTLTRKPGNIEVEALIPITSNFGIELAQKSGEIDDSSFDKPQASPCRFIMTITPGQHKEPSKFLIQSAKQLQPFLDECRLIQETNNALEDGEEAFVWLDFYGSEPPFQLGVFLESPDLRSIHDPPHTRLSNASAGFPGDEFADIELIKQDWIRQRAWELCTESAGTDNEMTISLRLGTFNVNGKPPSQDLSHWIQRPPGFLPPRGMFIKDDPENISNVLPPIKKNSPFSLAYQFIDYVTAKVPAAAPPSGSDRGPSQPGELDEYNLTSKNADPDADLLVLAFQELDLSTEALLYSTGTAKEDAWCMAVLAGLGEKGADYEKLASNQLVGMLIIIFVKKKMRACFQDIKVCSAGAGIMGIMGNKGATAVRLTFSPPPSARVKNPLSTTITFVNSHLAAFDEMVDKRNQDFNDLSKRLGFDSGSSDGRNLYLKVYETDLLFWMGGLIPFSKYGHSYLPDSDVRGILSSKDWDNKSETLLQYDQLKASIREKKAFDIFSEFPITHLPTYRFAPGQPTDDLGYDLK